MSEGEQYLEVEDDAPEESKGFLSVPLCDALWGHSSR